MARTLRFVILLLCLCQGAAWASIRITPPAIPEIDPGSYVTLPVRLAGNGEVTITLLPEAGWELVTSASTRTLQPGKEDVLFLTLRAPQHAEPGPVHAVEVRIRDAAGDVAVAAPTVRIRGLHRIRFILPAETVTPLDETARIEATLENDGNVPALVELTARDPLWRTSIEPPALTLAPDASMPVVIKIHPPSGTQSGFRYLLRLEARVKGMAEIVRTSGAVRFEGEQHTEAAAGRPPRLAFGVRLQATAGLTKGPSGIRTAIGWTVRPELGGDLSDYVRGRIDPGQWSGSVADPFESVPRNASISLWGDDWGLNLSTGSNGVTLSGRASTKPVQYSFGVGYRPLQDGPSYSAHGSAGGQLPGVRLDAAASWRASATNHVETARVSARSALSDSVSLNASVTAIGGSGVDGGYTVIPSVSADVLVSNPNFELRPRYQAYPTLGEYELSLSAGTKSLVPFGARGYASYAWPGATGTRSQLRTGATVFYSPARGLTLQLNGGFASAGGPNPTASWSVNPRVAFRTVFVGGVDLSGALSYEHTQPLVGAPPATDAWGIDAALALNGVRASVSADHRYRSASDRVAPLDRFTVAADASWDVGFDTTLGGSYALRADRQPVDLTRHAMALSWEQAWPYGLSSQLTLRHAIDQLPAGNTVYPDSLSVGVQLPPLPFLGLRLAAAYRVTAPYGVFAPATRFDHALRVGVGIRFDTEFDTPKAIVDVFGGRKIAKVEGQVFMDADGDGSFGAGDTPLTGVGLDLGPVDVVSGPDGRFQAYLPAGSYEVTTALGVPAGLGLPASLPLDVSRNERVTLAVPLRPVTTIAVSVFNDHDRDGRRSEDEIGIPHARVRISGALEAEGVADGRGTVVFRNIPAGRYLIAPTDDGLPPGYRPTGEPITLNVNPTDGPVATRLGASPPPKRVVTTFSSGDLSVFASPERRSVPAGGEVKVIARTAGNASQVWVLVDGVPFHLTNQDGAWVGFVAIPRDTEKGMQMITVTAVGASDKVTATFRLRVTDGPLVTARDVITSATEDVTFWVTTEYRASKVTLSLPDGSPMALEASDRRTWHGTAAGGFATGTYVLPVTVDGENRGDLRLVVEAPR